MKILQVKRFRQPDQKTEITLQRLEVPYLLPFVCERLVDDSWQERHYGVEDEYAKKLMAEWEQFERRIGSKEM